MASVSTQTYIPFSILEPVDLPPRALPFLTATCYDQQIMDQWLASDCIALDYETMGNDPTHPDFEAVGLGVGWSEGHCYYDFTNMPAPDIELLHEQLALAALTVPVIAHNVYFDGAVWFRLTGEHLPWAACTYGLYKQLTSEGVPGQRYGLKSIQEQILGWRETNEEGLDRWLIDNGYVKNVSKEQKQGYYWYPEWKDEGRWVSPDKAEMWRAPAEVLGRYCQLDCEATYLLYTGVLAPKLKEFPELDEYHNDLFLTLVEVLIEQRFIGINIDKEQLEYQLNELMDILKQSEMEFRNHREIVDYIEKYEASLLREHLSKEPPQYKKQKAPPKEPKRLRKDGTVSKAWTNWKNKMAEGNFRRKEIRKDWLAWREKKWQIEAGEMPDYRFKLNSPQQLQQVIYQHYAKGYWKVLRKHVPDPRGGSKPSVRGLIELITPEGRTVQLEMTDSGALPTGKIALSQLGDVGEILMRYMAAKKEAEYVQAYLDLIRYNEETDLWTLHPSFNVPGTLTGRLGGKEPNIQQVPKTVGTCSAFIPRPGYTWVDNDHCLTPEHDVLTPRGWVPILELVDTDKVWQVNPSSLQGSWVLPQRIVRKEYEGEVYTYGNRRGSIRVTDKHRMLWAGQATHPSKERQRWETLADEGLPNSGAHMILGTKHHGMTPHTFKDRDIRLACMLHADSHYNGSSYTLELSKERKIEQAKELLGEDPRVTGRGTKLWRVGVETNPFLEGKEFTNSLELLGPEQFDLFVESLGFWNGYLDRTGTITWTSTRETEVDKLQALLVRRGYEARKKLTDNHRKSKNWSPCWSLTIRKKQRIRLRECDITKEYYKGHVGCVTVSLGYFLVRREGQTFVTGNCALEQVVLAELSRDETLLHLYGPEAKANDVYLYVGSFLPGGIGDRIRATGYDPEDPTPATIRAAKKECKRERSISKVVVLASSYGAGADKIFKTLYLSGIDITIEEVQAILETYWSLFAGVREWEATLLSEYKARGGWFYGGLGRPICLWEKMTKDIVNRNCQATGHDVHMLYVRIIRDLLDSEGIEWYPIIIDWHDQSIVECRPEDAERVAWLIGHRAYEILNEELGGYIPMRGDPQIIDNLAYAKCEGEEIDEYLHHLMEAN